MRTAIMQTNIRKMRSWLCAAGVLLATAIPTSQAQTTNSHAPAGNKAANTSTTITSSKNPSAFDETVTFTATVDGQEPTGTVTFLDGSTALGTGTLTNGVATFSTNALTIGHHSMKAEYGGDANNKKSSSSHVTQFVRASTTTTLVSSVNPASPGQSVTFTATVTGSSPTGSVAFYDNGTQIGTGTLSGTGNTRNAWMTTSTLAAGALHPITASYAGDTNNANSATTTAVSQGVQIATTTNVVVNPASPVYGQAVTLTATVAGSAPTGTVTFAEGSTTLGVATLSGGTGSITVSNFTVAAHSITATYSSDLTNQASSKNLTVTVGKADTTVGIAISPVGGSSYGQAVTLAATISPPNVAGSVTFKEGMTPLGSPVNVVSGTATLSTNTLAVGQHNNLTATFVPTDNNYNGSTSPAAAPYAISQRATTVVLTPSPSPSTYGQNVTLTAAVSGSSPTGMVTFAVDGTNAGSSPINASGVATFATSTMTGGTHSLAATYAGDTNNAGSSGTASHAVNLASTTTALASSLNPSTYGQGVTFTATVAGSTPSGTVTFKVDNLPLGTATLSNSSATYTTNALTAGNARAVTALYSGDANNAASTGSMTQAVNQAGTTTTVTTSAGAPTYGQPITWTATVTGSGATGTVTFKDDTTTLGSATLSGGTASFSSSTLAGGTRTITAIYSGDANYVTSSGSVAQTVVAAATTTTLASSANPANYGANLTFTATVNGSTPTGSVTFKDGPAALGTANLSGNTASYTTSALATGGNHAITAVYSGDANNATSTSAELTQTVSALATTTTLASSQNPSIGGQSVTFTATVSGGNNPGGTVTFKDDTATLGSATLNGGSATFSVSTLTAGAHPITAIYAGDANNATSTGAMTQTVNNNATTTTLVVTPALASPGETITLAASVSGNNPSGTITFSEGATTLGVATLASGSASFTLNNLVVGNHTFTASYSGDFANPASTGTAVLLIANRGPYTWQYGYDAEGRLNTVVDPNGVPDPKNLATYIYYDRLGRPIQARQPGNTVIGLSWDPQDNLSSVADPRNLTTGYTVNGLGNTMAESSPDRGGSSYTFDRNGNVLSRTDARGKTTTYTYDSLDRLKSISYATGTGTTFEYDGDPTPSANEAGELTKMTDESGSTTYAHDAMGRLITKTVTISGRTFTVSYSWGDSGSALDKLTRITYPSGNQVNYSYNAAGFVSGITVTPSGASAQTLLSNVTYNVDGSVMGWQWSDGKVRTIGYDSVGMVASYTLGDPTGTGNKAGTTRTLTRDSAGRITGYVHSNGQSQLDQGFAYDVLNRLTSETVNGTTTAYTYDATGNRTSKVIGGATYVNTVDANSNKLTQTQDVNGTANLQYDMAGNVTSDGMSTYAYSDRGRMASASASGASFLYNGLEQRAYKTSSIGTRYYVYDEGGQLLGEYSANGAAVYETVYLGLGPVGTIKAGMVYNVHADQIDTPRVITQQDHTIVWRWDTAEAFGADGPNQNPSGLGVFVYNQRFPGRCSILKRG
jgi:YD repeat-containing protein